MTVHFKQSDPRCDSLWGINLVADMDPVERDLDLNACAGAKTDWNLHWPDGPLSNHYGYMFVRYNWRGKEVRREMTFDEKHRPVMQWKDSGIQRWRKTLEPGKSVESKQKPATVKKRSYQCRVRGVRPHWELKSAQYRYPSMAERIVYAITASGFKKATVMVLATIPYWRGKCMSASLAGAHVTLLAHDAPRPVDLLDWFEYINNVSGSWS